jgi:hypothetical protein
MRLLGIPLPRTPKMVVISYTRGDGLGWGLE